MKNLFTFLLLLLVYYSHSQETFVCGTSSTQSNLTVNYSSNSSQSNIDTSTPYVFNVYFNIIKDDFGNFSNNTFTVSEYGIQNAVRYLNIVFNSSNIYFKYYGMRQIDSSQYTSLNAGVGANSLHDEYAIPNALNFFIVNNFTGFTGITPNAFVKDGKTSLFFTRSTFSDQVGNEQISVVHEMGHVLNLKHTFENYNQSTCERVTRDQSNPLYNANTHGDQIEDTPAQPQQPCCPDPNDCSLPFNSTQTNFYNEQFENIIYGNFMSNSTNCNRHFSPGQVLRMRESIESNWDYYQPAMNSVESLYQPFETITEGGGTVISSEDLENGYAMVCRNIVAKQRFQKGFDYIFPDNDGIIDPLTADNNQIPLIRNHDLNYGVIITQINPNQEQEVLICTRGQICEEEKIIKGSDYVTPFLGSYNFTFEEWDELKVSDPNLYSYLEQNKYHLIKKETEKGVIIEVTIYKN